MSQPRDLDTERSLATIRAPQTPPPQCAAAANPFVAQPAPPAFTFRPPWLTRSCTQVYLNGEKLPVKSFQDYCDLYLGPKDATGVPRTYERVNDRCAPAGRLWCAGCA